MNRPLTRPIFLTCAWLGTAAWLYLSMVALDLYWNLFDWTPKLDLITFGLLASIGASLATAWFLSRATQPPLTRILSLLLCLFLLCIAVYVVTPEPVQTEGLLHRTSSSPIWYRSLRVFFMALPGLFWLRAPLHR